jgi:hypothetical protein
MNPVQQHVEQAVQGEPLTKQQWHAQLLERALASNSGNRSWRAWKRQAAESLLSLANASPRMQVLELLLEGELDAVYGIRMPVPRWPRDEQLVVGCGAVFHLRYEETWRWESPAGWAPVGLVSPLDPFHPNMRPALRGAICLGKVAPGVQPKQLVCSAYEALCLQDYALDESDPDGVMNHEACEFYRVHPEYCPLTSAGLCDEWSPPHAGAPGIWQL